MNLQILVVRDIQTAISTTSVIKLNGISYYYGLEPPQPLPAGEYEVWLRWSAHNGRWVLAVMNVPGHTDIEVHIGNRACDTRDCLVVGKTRSTNLVETSAMAYGELFQAVVACLPRDRVTIKYIDAYPEVQSGD